MSIALAIVLFIVALERPKAQDRLAMVAWVFAVAVLVGAIVALEKLP